MNQVINPVIPYTGPISGGLHVGKEIVIAGHVPYGSDRFTVNLQTAQDSSSDRPLHISVRFDSGNIIVRNTLQDECWESEERSGPFLFALGQNFFMRICVERTGYRVSVNGQHCFNFAHRLPFTRVTTMFIDGDVIIDEIEYINVIPTQHPAVYNPPANPVYVIPYTGPISGGLHEGKEIVIAGNVPYGADRFTVNLQTAQDSSSDRPLHISVNFEDENTMVRDTLQDDCWVSQERSGLFPFALGQNFFMRICVERTGYRVSVNGQHCFNFAHRLPFTRVTTMFIDGDVIVDEIEYINVIPTQHPAVYNPPANPVYASTPGHIVIPYTGPITGGLHEGKEIVIAGNVPYGADRFTVNLQTAQDSSSDRPLHISVRFDSGNIIVRNTLQDECWGSEERSGPFPFALGQNFFMRLCVERTGYRISINGQHCFNYAHRLPFTRVTTMFIDGDVNIDEIEYINGIPTQYPAVYNLPANPVYASTPVYATTQYPAVYNPPANPVYASTPVYATPLPCLPYTFPLYGGIKPGMSIHITGRPSANPQRFAINLQNGASTYSPAEIAFQLDVRFYSNIIARNSRIGNVWGLEEVMTSYFPFRHGQNFDMTIRVQGDCYMVDVNGLHFVTFRHRLHDFDRIDTLYIENNVIVSSIRYT